MFDILDHKRVHVGWVLRVHAHEIMKVARVAVVFPLDGAGRVRVLVSDFSNTDPIHFKGAASGFGYDKLTAALAGASVGGEVLGGHCDRFGRPTLETLCAERGYTWIKGW